MSQYGGQGGEEFVHQDHIVLKPQDQIHVVSHHLLKLVVTEDEVGDDLLFFGPVGLTGTSERGCSEWIFTTYLVGEVYKSCQSMC